MIKQVLLALALVLSTGAWAQFSSAPAFPGAEGYGRYVSGGRGGQVYHVTSLKDDSNVLKGTLRYGIEKLSGSRIIVFDKAGTIELYKDLKIENGNISILGQTAPGDGICLAGFPVVINANNVIMRYIRCRMGDTSGEEDDALGSSHHAGSGKKNIIIDHCSVSWSTDECASFYGNENFTMQWCMVTESLRNSIHEKNTHGYGGIWGGTRASFHHNLLAHHDSRNARLDHDYVQASSDQLIDYINNGFYNWGGNTTYGGESKGKDGNHYRKVNFIGNYYKPGPASKAKGWIFNMTNKCGNCDGSDPTNIEPAHLYLTGNIMEGNSTINNNNWAGVKPDLECDVTKYKSTSRYIADDQKFQGYNTITIQPADVAFNKLLKYAGCSLSRDAVDSRICNEAKNGTFTYTGSNGSTNGLIDSQADVKGWPSLSGGSAPTDTDGDGMPDEWESLNGLNPNVNDAALYTLDSKGYYTNIEVYANSLVEENIKQERADASETFEEYYPYFKMYKWVTTETKITSGSIVYPFASNASEASDFSDIEGQPSAGISQYLYEATADHGEILTWEGKVFTALNDFALASIKNGDSTSGEKADGSSDSEITLTMVPDDESGVNCKFKVTGLHFSAAKNGTSSSASLTVNSGDTNIIFDQDLPRAYSSTDGYKAPYTCDMSSLDIPTPLSATSLAFIYNGGAAGKQLGISDVTINVDVMNVETKRIIVDNTTAIQEIISVQSNKKARNTKYIDANGIIRIGNYNMLGQRIR